MKGRQELASSFTETKGKSKDAKLTTARKSLSAFVADWSDSEDEDGWWCSPMETASAAHRSEMSGPSLFSDAQLKSLQHCYGEAGKPVGPVDQEYREGLRAVLDTMERFTTKPDAELPSYVKDLEAQRMGDTMEALREEAAPSNPFSFQKAIARLTELNSVRGSREVGESMGGHTPSYGLKASDVLVSHPPTPQLAICPAKPLPRTPVKPESIASDQSEPVLSPNSQKTLRKMYLDDLLSASTNTPASKQVLKIIEFEDVSLDTSLGLRLLDLAKALRSDGEYGETPKKAEEEENGRDLSVLMMTKVLDKINDFTKVVNGTSDKGRTPEKVEPEEKARDIGILMMTTVLDKLNDHSGMLNAIAEQVGVNLVDDDEEAESRDQATSKVAEPPSTLADSNASLALSDGTAATSTTGESSNIPTVPVPAAVRIAEVAAALNKAPELFSPKPVPSVNLAARSLPSTDAATSETSESESEAEADTPAATPTVANSQSTTPRNPFADPPRFGQSYGPLRPLDAASTTGGRPADPVAAGPTSSGFARYAASSAGNTRRDFWSNVDSYASPPASVFGSAAGPRPYPGHLPSHWSQQGQNQQRQGLFFQPPGRPLSLFSDILHPRPPSPTGSHPDPGFRRSYHGSQNPYAYVGSYPWGESTQFAQAVWNGYEYIPPVRPAPFSFSSRDPRCW